MKIIILILILSLFNTKNYLPVLFHHGIDADGKQFDRMRSWLNEHHPNTKTFALNHNTGLS
jgi:hypothetical protein